MKKTRLTQNSIRGRIRTWIETHSDKLGDNVLEVGSRRHVPGAWWVINNDLAKGRWTGIDMQEGDGVDIVADIHSLPSDWRHSFTGILCSEVLEHVERPWVALPKLVDVLIPGGTIVITTLQCFPVHGFPNDYYRFTESGLRVLLQDAGFVDIEVASAGEVIFKLDDHGNGSVVRKTPMHVFAIAKAPSA